MRVRVNQVEQQQRQHEEKRTTLIGEVKGLRVEVRRRDGLVATNEQVRQCPPEAASPVRQVDTLGRWTR